MIGLKDTLTLLKSGMSLQEIKEREALDQNPPDEHKADDPAPAPDPEPESDPEPEPDYKKMYEDLLKEKKKSDKDLHELQQEKVHENNAPAYEQAKVDQDKILSNIARRFM